MNLRREAIGRPQAILQRGRTAMNRKITMHECENGWILHFEDGKDKSKPAHQRTLVARPQSLLPLIQDLLAESDSEP